MANVDPAPFISPYEIQETELTGIWLDLKNAIKRQVKRDGIRKDTLLPGQLKEYVIDDAVEQIYWDVASFYYWYFEPDDPRNQFAVSQKNVPVPKALESIVAPVVEENLSAMREVDEIPQELDTGVLAEVVTDTLVRYIVNWEDWYYERREEEAIDAYYELQGVYEDIYFESDYGDLSNGLDPYQYDGHSDVPFIAEP